MTRNLFNISLVLVFGGIIKTLAYQNILGLLILVIGLCLLEPKISRIINQLEKEDRND